VDTSVDTAECSHQIAEDNSEPLNLRRAVRVLSGRL
jgi:hypothetical protein